MKVKFLNIILFLAVLCGNTIKATMWGTCTNGQVQCQYQDSQGNTSWTKSVQDSSINCCLEYPVCVLCTKEDKNTISQALAYCKANSPAGSTVLGGKVKCAGIDWVSFTNPDTFTAVPTE